MTKDTQLPAAQSSDLLPALAQRYAMQAEDFRQTLMGTVVPSKCTEAEFMSFLVVASEHGLNPLTKEIYAMPTQRGIQPIVSVDGWMTLANNHAQYDGMTFEDLYDANGGLRAITCSVHRKDRSHPIQVTEYLGECLRNTAPWKQWPARMLRHKAAIQALRYAFGFSGFIDPDEYDRFGSQPHEPEVVDRDAIPSIVAEPSAQGQLPKGQSRDLYTELQENIDACGDEEMLSEWGRMRTEDLKTLPNDWQTELRKRYVEKRDELRAEATKKLEKELEDAPF